MVGTAVKRLGWKPLIATKCGLLWDDEKRKHNCLRKLSIKKECEDSLVRLGVEVIDLYQMHWPYPTEELEEGWDAMSELVKEGKVRYLGASNFSKEDLCRVLPIHPPVSIQPPYSMLKRSIETSLIPFCAESNIGIVVYSPLERGLLTGKFTSEKIANLPADDNRHGHPFFSEPQFSKLQRVIEKLKEIAACNNISLAQLAIAWVLRDGAITSAIAGARRAGQISQTAAAGDIVLTESDIEQIEIILKEFEAETD